MMRQIEKLLLLSSFVTLTASCSAGVLGNIDSIPLDYKEKVYDSIMDKLEEKNKPGYIPLGQEPHLLLTYLRFKHPYAWDHFASKLQSSASESPVIREAAIIPYKGPDAGWASYERKRKADYESADEDIYRSSSETDEMDDHYDTSQEYSSENNFRSIETMPLPSSLKRRRNRGHNNDRKVDGQRGESAQPSTVDSSASESKRKGKDTVDATGKVSDQRKQGDVGSNSEKSHLDSSKVSKSSTIGNKHVGHGITPPVPDVSWLSKIGFFFSSSWHYIVAAISALLGVLSCLWQRSKILSLMNCCDKGSRVRNSAVKSSQKSDTSTCNRPSGATNVYYGPVTINTASNETVV